MQAEIEKWIAVEGPISAVEARKIFGVPKGWPCKFDGFSAHKHARRWLVLSPAWVRQQNTSTSSIRTSITSSDLDDST